MRPVVYIGDLMLIGAGESAPINGIIVLGHRGPRPPCAQPSCHPGCLTTQKDLVGALMSISFTQSMQSLYADRGYAALWGVGLAVLCLLLWLGWFLTPSLTVYAHGHLVKMTRNGTLVAELPVQESTDLRAGQTAHIYPTNTPQHRLTATVLEVASQDNGNQIQVMLYLNDDTAVDDPFAAGVDGEVQVAIATIAPATLLFQTLEQWGITRGVSLSPQRQR